MCRTIILFFNQILLTDMGQGVNISFLNNTQKLVCTISLLISCLKKQIHTKILLKPLFSIVLVLIKRSLLGKILSVKTCIICRGIFRTQSSNYHGAFFTKKKLTSFSRWKKTPEAFYKKGCSENFSKSTGKTFNTFSFLIKLQA